MDVGNSARFMVKVYKINLSILIVAIAGLLLTCSDNIIDPAEDNPSRQATDSIIPFSNMVLCYGGSHHRPTYLWDQERFSKYTTYTDINGDEHWLFDAFLCIEFANSNRSDGKNYSYCLGMYKNKSGESAGKNQWEELIEYWFKPSANLHALDAELNKDQERLGELKAKRKIVFVMPDPIIHQYFDDLNSSTTYWGELNGKQLDFSNSQDRIDAYCWYIDKVIDKFKEARFDNIDLIGFYIVSEDLATPDNGWDYEMKKMDLVIPYVSDYIHSKNLKVFWIPYRNGANYQNKAKFRIDYVWLQPNYLWRGEEAPIDDTMLKIKSADVGMEMELDERVLSGKETSELYRTRYRKYMQFAKQYRIYGDKPFTYYIGNNVLYDLAISKDEDDVSLYHEYCQFVINNPLNDRIK